MPTTDLADCNTHSQATIRRTKTHNLTFMLKAVGMGINSLEHTIASTASRVDLDTIGSTASRRCRHMMIIDTMLSSRRGMMMDMVSSRDMIRAITSRTMSVRSTRAQPLMILDSLATIRIKALIEPSHPRLHTPPIPENQSMGRGERYRMRLLFLDLKFLSIALVLVDEASGFSEHENCLRAIEHCRNSDLERSR